MRKLNTASLYHRIKISNRRAIRRCNVSSFFYAKICSLLARRRSSQPVQRVYWPENVIDWLGKCRPTCVMRHARGQKLQSFRRKWPFYIDLYSMSIPGPNIHIYPHLIPGIHLCIMFQQTVHDVKMSIRSCPMKSRSLPLQKKFTSIRSLDRLYFNGHFPVKSRSEYVSWHLGNP
jgi:hypothetical protein